MGETFGGNVGSSLRGEQVTTVTQRDSPSRLFGQQTVLHKKPENLFFRRMVGVLPHSWAADEEGAMRRDLDEKGLLSTEHLILRVFAITSRNYLFAGIWPGGVGETHRRDR